MRPIGGVLISLFCVILAAVGAPLSVWQSVGRGEIIAAGAMLLIGLPLFVAMGRWSYLENRRVATHRRDLRQNRPLRYYAGKTIRGLVIVGIVAAAVVDLMYFGAAPQTVVKASIVLLAMAAMVSVTASSVLAGAGDVISN